MESDIGALVEGYRRGERDAGERLARHAVTIALRTAAAMLRDIDQAHDTAQDAAVKALSNIDGLRDADRFDVWVHRIAARESLRALRRQARRSRRESPLTAELPSADSPAHDTESRLQEADLRRAMRRLPSRQRLALILRYTHGLSESQIAEILGCPTGTAASLLSRGRASLRGDSRLRDCLDRPAKEGKL